MVICNKQLIWSMYLFSEFPNSQACVKLKNIHDELTTYKISPHSGIPSYQLYPSNWLQSKTSSFEKEDFTKSMEVLLEN